MQDEGKILQVKSVIEVFEHKIVKHFIFVQEKEHSVQGNEFESFYYNLCDFY
jgi:hypothetical protein